MPINPRRIQYRHRPASRVAMPTFESAAGLLRVPKLLIDFYKEDAREANLRESPIREPLELVNCVRKAMGEVIYTRWQSVASRHAAEFIGANYSGVRDMIGGGGSGLALSNRLIRYAWDKWPSTSTPDEKTKLGAYLDRIESVGSSRCTLSGLVRNSLRREPRS